MPLAVEDLIADAVAVELNQAGQAWTLPNVAIRAYDTVFTQAELASLRVVSIPLTLDWSRQSRGGTDRFEYGVTIDLQKHLDASSDLTAQIEALNLIAQQQHDWFRMPHLLAATSFECFEAKRPEIFIPPRLWHDRVWETYLELMVRVHR